MKTISEFEVLDHGIENCQYFQGCGTSFTDYDDVATGIGDNFAEAIEDALESLAQNDWDTEDMIGRIEDDLGVRKLPVKPSVSGNSEEHEDTDDIYYHVSIRVK